MPPLVRRLRGGGNEAGDTVDDAEGEAGIESPATIVADLKAGWAFLRHETVLLANTLQGTAGQFAIGIVTVASIILAQADHRRRTAPSTARPTRSWRRRSGWATCWAASRWAWSPRAVRKGRLVIAAYTVFGVLVFFIGISDSIPVILGLLFGVGVANMAFVIPSQTLFQERTPPEMMGRVVSFRFALVFGGMSVAMAVGGLFVGVLRAGPGDRGGRVAVASSRGSPASASRRSGRRDPALPVTRRAGRKRARLGTLTAA